MCIRDRSGRSWESRERANPVIRRGVVVGIAVAVDIAHAGGRTAHDGAEPPIDAKISKGQHLFILPLSYQFHARPSALDELYVIIDVLNKRLEPRQAYVRVERLQALQVLEQLVAVGDSERHKSLALIDVSRGVRVERIRLYEIHDQASGCLGHRDGEDEPVRLRQLLRCHLLGDLCPYLQCKREILMGTQMPVSGIYTTQTTISLLSRLDLMAHAQGMRRFSVAYG